MEQRQWQDTLRLLCMMIHADDRLYQEEVKAFQDAAMQLRDEVTPNLMLTRKMLMDWFMDNQAEVKESLQSFNYDSAVSSLLTRMNDIPNKKELIIAMMKVAMADGDRHVAEDKLVVIACQAWDLDISLAS